MANKFDDTVKMSLHIDGGLPGVDDDPDNPLSKATRSTLVYGRPQQKLSLCLYKDTSLDGTEEKHRLKWFGVFELSSGRNLIFSPGFNLTSTGIKAARNLYQQKQYDISIDHITLEKNFRRWHFTGTGSRHPLGSELTTNLGDNRFLWFGLSLASSNILKDVREETVYQVEVASSDSKRRMEAFITSREGVVFNTISVHPDAMGHFNTGFLHFGLIVGPSGFKDYLEDNLGIPFKSPFLTKDLPNQLINIPTRRHRISLGSEVDIEIVVLWLPGSLTERVMFSPH